MKTISLTEFKNNFSALMDLVKRGKETLLVCERSNPVATVSATLEASDAEDNGLVQRLERAGHLKRAVESPQAFKIKKFCVKPKKKVDILAVLLDQRREER